jgi:hypothetical protein
MTMIPLSFSDLLLEKLDQHFGPHTGEYPLPQ